MPDLHALIALFDFRLSARGNQFFIDQTSSDASLKLAERDGRRKCSAASVALLQLYGIAQPDHLPTRSDFSSRVR